MFAIAFDMSVALLREHYGNPYNSAYYEISEVLEEYDFFNTQGSVYLTENTDMSNLFDAIDALKNIPWFPDSVRDIRAFRVEDWSDFTSFVKRKKSDMVTKKEKRKNR
jgi:virulence-associated protein VapD